jgi:hypothetical protein
MIPSGHFDNMRDQFMEAAALVMEEHPATRSFKPQDYGEGFDRPINYHKRSVQCMIRDIDYFIEYLATIPVEQIASLEITEEGVYLKGQQFDALLKFDKIISKATSEIILVDNYVDSSILELLASKMPNVKCRVLTTPQSLSASLQQFIAAFNQQYKNLEVHTSIVFHDRFVIIDQKDFYHFGASIKDAGKKGFMFSKIEQPSWQKVVLDEFNAQW